MEATLIYLLKSAALLSIFLIAYQLLLRNDTTFQVNRQFLFWGLLTAFTLPGIEFTRTVIIEQSSVPIMLQNEVQTPNLLPSPQESFDWWMAAGTTYLIGLAFFTIKFLIEFYSLLSLIKTGSHVREGRFTVVSSEKKISPFSFFGYIVVNPQLHTPEELQMILQHEKIHASQWHSADVLLANIAVTLLWFFPLSWWYRKSLVQNLEYLADKGTVAAAAAVPKKAYQHTLLKISVAEVQPALANNFYQPFIKKRIMMLNKKPSHGRPVLKMGAVLPLLLAFICMFNIKTEAQVVTKKEVASVVFQDDFDLTARITKHAQEEELKKIAEMFREQGVELSFDTIEYSDGHLLTKLSGSFIRRESGQTGNFNLHNSEGIGDTLLKIKDGEFSLSSAATSPSSEGLLEKVGEKPLFIINGKEYTSSKLAGKTVELKGNVSALAPKEAMENLGNKARDGVIIIEKGEIINDFETALKKLDKNKYPVKTNYISVEKNSKPTLVSLEMNITGQRKTPENEKINASLSLGQGVRIFSADTIHFSSDSIQPLFIIDGKIMDAEEVASVNEEGIEKIEVLKGETAIEKYGEKGKNGVVIISLKRDRQAKGQNDLKLNTNKLTVSGDREKEGTKMTFEGESHVTFDKDKATLNIIDGKIMDKDFDPEDIEPETIESINVLKNKAATQKYGARAAEGVIEITTKKK